MRNLTLFGFLTIASFSVSSAQNIKFGITAGPVFTTSTRESAVVDAATNRSHKTIVQSYLSYFGGAVISVPLSNYLTFRPQIEYMQKGWQNFVDYETLEDNHTRLKINYIDVPLNLVYNIPTKSGRFFIGAGPYLSYALSAKVHNDNNGIDTDLSFSSVEDTTVQNANRFDIGGNLIAGYEFRNGIFLTLNYEYGFKDFRTDLRSETVVKGDNKNRTVGFGIGYMFNKH